MTSDAPTPAWHMRRALRLAEKGRGFTLPNPMVGAVIVKGGERIGEGFHERYGEAHAEVKALESCTVSPEGATLYVTLEPCCHFGKTPPCTQAIIKSGIKKVVIASQDPSREGIKELEAAGIEVEVGLLEEAARELNRDFFTYHGKKRPFITLKAALSLDGKIALTPNEATPLTGDLSRKLTHVMRHEHHAILVGAGTVLADDPHLGVRHIEGRDPLRIILKGDREIPMDHQVFRDENVLVCDDLQLPVLMQTLYEKGVVSVLVEGGSTVFTEFLKHELWDEMKLFYAPTLLGHSAVPFCGEIEPLGARVKNVRQCGPDLLVTLAPPWDLDPS